MAITALTLNTKVYSLQSDQGGIITWSETSGGIPTGFSDASLSLRKPAKAGSPWRIELHLDLPQIAEVANECACPGQILASEKARVIVELPGTATTAIRTDFGLRLKDLMANAQIQATIANLVRPS